MKRDASYYIEHLNLAPHPEGGYYKSSFASNEEMEVGAASRKLYTSIYFLLETGNVSHFHRLKSDEVWYYHAGSPLIVHMFDEDGDYTEMKLGLDFEKGEVPQAIVPKNSIFGSSIMDNNAFSLVGCMVSPGFDFEDFELFTQEELIKDYPDHVEVIKKLAYEKLV